MVVTIRDRVTEDECIGTTIYVYTYRAVKMFTAWSARAPAITIAPSPLLPRGSSRHRAPRKRKQKKEERALL